MGELDLEDFRAELKLLERRAHKARDEERILASQVKELKGDVSAKCSALLKAIGEDEVRIGGDRRPSAAICGHLRPSDRTSRPMPARLWSAVAPDLASVGRAWV